MAELILLWIVQTSSFAPLSFISSFSQAAAPTRLASVLLPHPEPAGIVLVLGYGNVFLVGKVLVQSYLYMAWTHVKEL